MRWRRVLGSAVGPVAAFSAAANASRLPAGKAAEPETKTQPVPSRPRAAVFAPLPRKRVGSRLDRHCNPRLAHVADARSE